MAKFSNMSSMNYKSQKEGFLVERLNGYPKYTFLHFISSAKVFYKGSLLKTAPHAMILYPPGVYQAFGAADEPFVNGFVHFEIDDDCFFRHLHIPFNKIFYIDIIKNVSYVIEEVTWLLSPDVRDAIPEYSEKASDLLNQLFTEISIAWSRSDIADPNELALRHKFDALRSTLYHAPQEWNVQKMADATCFSRSRFTVLYSRIYHITPCEDRIRASLLMAKKLLTTTKLPVNEIACLCGYEAPSYFNRLFKANEKMTPGRYRKNTW